MPGVLLSPHTSFALNLDSFTNITARSLKKKPKRIYQAFYTGCWTNFIGNRMRVVSISSISHGNSYGDYSYLWDIIIIRIFNRCKVLLYLHYHKSDISVFIIIVCTGRMDIWKKLMGRDTPFLVPIIVQQPKPHQNGQNHTRRL